MIDIKNLDDKSPRPETGRTFLEDYKKSLSARGGDPFEVDRLLAINKKRKSLMSKMEAARAKQKKVGQEIAILKKEKKDASDLLQEMQGLSLQLKEDVQGSGVSNSGFKRKINFSTKHMPSHNTHWKI